MTAPFGPDSGKLTIHCGILIDGMSDQPNTFQTVEIIDGRISSIGYSVEDVDLDLSTYTCMPGFIDTHMHIAENISSADGLLFKYRGRK